VAIASGLGDGGRGWGCWVIWGRRWKKNGCFMLLDVFVAYKTCPGERLLA